MLYFTVLLPQFTVAEPFPGKLPFGYHWILIRERTFYRDVAKLSYQIIIIFYNYAIIPLLFVYIFFFYKQAVANASHSMTSVSYIISKYNT